MTENRLLIVDDDRDFADSLAEALELEGYNCDVRYSGEDGIDAVAAGRYGAILMDIGLPRLNGVECLIRIRNIRPEARCFLLTGYSADHIAAQGIEAGAAEVMTKPVEFGELFKRLRGDAA